LALHGGEGKIYFSLQIIKEDKKKRKSFGLFDSQETFDSVPVFSEGPVSLTSYSSEPIQSTDFDSAHDYSTKLIPLLSGSFLKEKPSLTSSKNYVSTQKEVFSNWMSYILNFNVKSENIQKYFRNCIVPLDLVEKLSSVYAPKYLLNFEPQTEIMKLKMQQSF
jgi:hypothetical protein